MTTKQKIGLAILSSIVIIGYLYVSHLELIEIQQNTRATACATLNHTDESIINCIEEN